jgi:hypothetical protein
MAFTYDDPGNPNGQSNQAFFNQMTSNVSSAPPVASSTETQMSGTKAAVGVGALLAGAGAVAFAIKKGKFSNLKPLTKGNDVVESTVAKSHEAVKEKYIPKDDAIPNTSIVREASPIKPEEIRVGSVDDMLKPKTTTYNTGVLDKIFTDGGRLEMKDFKDMPDNSIFDLYGKWDSAAAAMAKNDPASDKAKSWTHNFENLQNELSTRGYTFRKVKEGDELDGTQMRSFGTQYSDTVSVDGVTEIFGSGQVVYKPNGRVAEPVNVRTSNGPKPIVE